MGGFLQRALGLTFAMVVIGVAGMPGAAIAQAYACNGAGPGEMQVGQVPGAQGFVTALCVRVDEPSDSPEDGTQPTGPERPVWQDRPTGSLPTDPYEDRLMYVLQMMQAGEAVEGELQALRSDPQYAAFQEGNWEIFHDGDERRGRGQSCTAMYASPAGLVVIASQDGGYAGALLTFIGGDIPAPGDPALIPVSLVQTGRSTPSEVRAHNYRMPDTELGAITFAVPSIQAALDGMLDIADFELSMRGRTVMTVGWRGGSAAKDRLAQCVSGRR